MPKAALIMTIGTGPNVEHAIAKSIQEGRPDRIVFIVSTDSTATVERVRATLEEQGLPFPANVSEKVVSDVDNPGRALEAVSEVIRELEEEGVLPNQITLDYTGGTKPMSAGALYAAISANIGSIRYVAGSRGRDGRVLSGTERIISETPNRLYARRVELQAIKLFETYQFTGAERIISAFLAPFHKDLIETEFGRLKALACLSSAYAAWDAFDHLDARAKFDVVDREMLKLFKGSSQEIARTKGWINKISEKMGSGDLSRRLSGELLIDLWANARRRMEERRYLDATARLYRLTELIAQYRLWHKYGIDTSDVDLAKVPDSLRAALEEHRASSGKIQVSLKMAYDLLEALSDELGKVGQTSRLRDALTKRNRSIAAHGLEPVNADTTLALGSATEQLLGLVIPNRDALLQEVRVPKLVV